MTGRLPFFPFCPAFEADSAHTAKKGDYAFYILMPGDPARVTYLSFSNYCRKLDAVRHKLSAPHRHTAIPDPFAVR